MKINLPDYNKASVLVVGDIILDRYYSGTTDRISPEAPVPVVKVDSVIDAPGGAANVATNVTSLCGQAILIGYMGDDPSAEILKNQLIKKSVICDFVTIGAHPTVTKLRILSRHQQLIRLDFEEKLVDVDASPLLEKIKKRLNKIKLIIISDYGKGTVTVASKIIDMARRHNLPVLIDPKGDDFERYYGATLLTPNISEFEAVVGHCKTEDQIVRRGYRLIKKCGLKALLITRSEKGMTLLQQDKAPIHLSANARDVYDVTGAGDTVIAVLGASLAAGSSLEEGCRLANLAAGIVVGKVGTSTVLPAELEKAVGMHTTSYLGLVTERELKSAVREARKRGETIVMTNGCFDILHAGHVSYLEKAREKGDKLIVAVNSDTSVKKIKGRDRPINSLRQRMLVVSALKSVDWVVSFDDDTPRRLIGEILPDVLVKGADYKIEDIVGGDEVVAAGGCVEVIDFEAGISTTAIIRAIKNSN